MQPEHRSFENADLGTLLKEFIGTSPVFRSEILKIPRIAASEATVLILGENGTGKELVARAIHRLSPRGSHPFVAVNCATIPPALAEDQLFGHVKGAFTGAHCAEEGYVGKARGGTLFLDELQCLSCEIQAKLLRLSQEHEYWPLGARLMHTADIRIVAATNRHPKETLPSGELRTDLYYRLSGVTLTMPPLRERLSDIALLANHFLAEFARKSHQPSQGLLPCALQKLLSYQWPGNIRELANVIAESLLLCDEPSLSASQILIREWAAPSPTGSLKEQKNEVVAQFYRTQIAAFLTASHGNINQAAKAAGTRRRVFFALIQKYAIDAKLFRELPAPPPPARSLPSPSPSR